MTNFLAVMCKTKKTQKYTYNKSNSIWQY